MGYLFWFILLLSIAFRAYKEGKWKKQLNTFANDFHLNELITHILFWIILGAVSIYYGIGLPQNGLSVLAISLSSLSVFTISYFLSKSNTRH